MKLKTKYQLVVDQENDNFYLIEFKNQREHSIFNTNAEIFKIDKKTMLEQIENTDKIRLGKVKTQSITGLRKVILDRILTPIEGKESEYE